MFYVWCCMLCCRCFNKIVSWFFVATRKKMRPPHAGVQGERSRVEDSLGSQMHCKNCEKQVKKLNYNFNAQNKQYVNPWRFLQRFYGDFYVFSILFNDFSDFSDYMWKMPSSFYEWNSFRQQKLRRRMSWPPRRSIWKMRKRPFAGKHYETPWKWGFEFLEWPTFSESLLGWARLL